MTVPIRPSASKIIRSLPKGQITLPVQMRRALGITDESLLQVTLEGDHIVIAPLRSSSDDNLRLYTDEEIAEFLAADKISPDLAAWVQGYVKRRKQRR